MRTFIRMAATALLLLSSVFPVLSQSVLYNGEVEAGVVVPRKFASAQINVARSDGAYFVKPQLFIGAGASVGWNLDAETWKNLYPVYGQIRKDFTINGRLTTFIDAKAGYSFQGNSAGNYSDSGVDYGFYCYPSVGLRYATSQKCGVYLKLGYTYQAATLSWLWSADGIWHEGSERHNAGGFSATIGFSFQ